MYQLDDYRNAVKAITAGKSIFTGDRVDKIYMESLK